MNAFTSELTTAIAIEKRHEAEGFQRAHFFGIRRRFRRPSIERIEWRTGRVPYAKRLGDRDRESQPSRSMLQSSAITGSTASARR
jgi:hypothetical protein